MKNKVNVLMTVLGSLIGQTSDTDSAQLGQARCPWWASSVPRLGKQRAHFTYKNGLYGEAVKQVGGKHGVCQPAAILRRNYCQQQCCRLRTIHRLYARGNKEQSVNAMATERTSPWRSNLNPKKTFSNTVPMALMPSIRSTSTARSSHSMIYIQLRLVEWDNMLK